MGIDPKLAEAAARLAISAAKRHGRDFREAADDPDLGALPDTDPCLPAAIFITYRGESGTSERAVTLWKVWRTGGVLYFTGQCHMRCALRTFRADRVEELVCLATGEVADDPADWLLEHGLFAGDRPRDYTAPVLRVCRDELALLAYMARIDGVFDAGEMEVVIDHVMMATERDIDRARVAKYVRRLAPNAFELRDLVLRVSQHPERWARLRRSLRRLVESDGDVCAAEESGWLELDQLHDLAEAEVRGGGVVDRMATLALSRMINGPN